MKFNQVPNGQQFEYQGEVYTRQGPIMATDSQGRGKMIPRSAEVRPLGEQAEPTPKPALDKTLHLEEARGAFEQAYSVLLAGLERAVDVEGRLPLDTVKACMDEARQVFLDRLSA